MSSKRVQGKLKKITRRRRRIREEPRVKRGPLGPSGINPDAGEKERRSNRAGWKARLDKRVNDSRKATEAYSQQRAGEAHAARLAEAEEYIRTHQDELKRGKAVAE